MFSKDLFTETWLYKDRVKAGRKEGKAQGKAEGKRESFRLALSAKFPDLGPLPEIDDNRRFASRAGHKADPTQGCR
jgi:hypothetical protein